MGENVSRGTVSRQSYRCSLNSRGLLQRNCALSAKVCIAVPPHKTSDDAKIAHGARSCELDARLLHLSYRSSGRILSSNLLMTSYSNLVVWLGSCRPSRRKSKHQDTHNVKQERSKVRASYHTLFSLHFVEQRPLLANHDNTLNS